MHIPPNTARDQYQLKSNRRIVRSPMIKPIISPKLRHPLQIPISKPSFVKTNIRKRKKVRYEYHLKTIYLIYVPLLSDENQFPSILMNPGSAADSNNPLHAWRRM